MFGNQESAECLGMTGNGAYKNIDGGCWDRIQYFVVRCLERTSRSDILEEGRDGHLPHVVSPGRWIS